MAIACIRNFTKITAIIIALIRYQPSTAKHKLHGPLVMISPCKFFQILIVIPFPIHDNAWIEPLVVKLQEEVLSLTTTLATKSQKLAESEKKVSESEKKVSDLEKRLNETGRAGLEADSNEQNDNYEPPTTPQTQDLDLYGSEMVLGASEATMDVCRKDVRITALEVELRERNRQLNERDMQLSEKVTEIKELKEERKKLLAEKDRLYQELLSRR